MKLSTPLELLVNVDIHESELKSINQKFYETNWEGVIDDSVTEISDSDIFFIDFATNESEKFALELYEYIEEIDDDELNSIFTIEFLREITKSWWIIPRLNLDD